MVPSPADKNRPQRRFEPAVRHMGWGSLSVRAAGKQPTPLIGGLHMSNPRYKNGTLRRKHRARFKAMGAPCGICRGRLGPIHYDEPSNAEHPLSFVIDEIKPISKWKLYGYESPEAAARDWNNLQAAHYCCNAAKGAKVNFVLERRNAARIAPIPSDGEWLGRGPLGLPWRPNRAQRRFTPAKFPPVLWVV